MIILPGDHRCARPDRRSEIFAGETFPRHRGVLVPRVSRIPSLAHHMAELRAVQAARRHPRSRSRQRGFIVNPYAYSSTPTDADFASVVLLCGFDDSGDLYKDDSSRADATGATLSGTVAWEGTTVKYGAGSFSVNAGSGVFNDATAWAFGSGDATVEGWFNPVSLTGTRWMMGQTSSAAADADTSFAIKTNTSAQLVCSLFHTGGGAGVVEVTGTTTWTTGTWRFFKWIRSGTAFRCGTNDTQEGGDGNISTFTLRDSAYKLAIGGLGEYITNRSHGYYDEVRITKGVGRAFTGSAPTAAFPRS